MKTEIPKETRYTHDFPSHYRKVITELEREIIALEKENEALHKTLSAAIDAARAKGGQSWGIDEIIGQHLREGGTPT